MTDEQIQELIDKNFKLLFLLGYITPMLSDYAETLPNDKKDKYHFFMQALENIVYHDKPWPKIP